MANTEADKETVRRIRDYLKEKLEKENLPAIPEEKTECTPKKSTETKKK